MSDPFKISDPQTEKILTDLEYKRRASSYNSSIQHTLHLETDEELKSALFVAGLNREDLPARHEKAFKVWLELKKLNNRQLQEQRREAEFSVYEMIVALATSCGDRLRLNTMTGQVELNSRIYKDTVIIEDRQYLNIIGEGNWLANKLPNSDAVLEYATTYKYSPVAEYLLLLPKIDPQSADQVLEELCSECLGQTEPLKKQMVIKTLIGAVARALKPGVQMQTVLTLIGNQNAGKTEFFKTLFGKEFFGSLNPQNKTQDWSMCLSQVWAGELGELEIFMGRHVSGAMKAFISEGQDLYRAPYDKKAKKHPRHSVLVATGNTYSPLVDNTGNRRWWPIDAPAEINLVWLKENRDTIWAAALLKYNAGETFWFSGEEGQAALDNAENYRDADPWEELLDEFLMIVENPELTTSSERVRQICFENLGRSSLTGNLTTASLLRVLGVEDANQTRAHATRLGGIMTALGYKKVQKRIEGQSPRVWVRATPRKQQV